MSEAPRVLAFYLPQYHPIPENDAWWGPGFTEWNNVVLGRPLFPGHHQPHLPRDLGFYDLRLPEAREAQAALAVEAGLSGFVYYHYWFGGKRLLHRPFDEVLASGTPALPFALCWANENWTRAWDGGGREVLIAQSHSEDDDRAHFDHLVPAFSDPRYLRVDGKPLFLVYRASLLPDPRRTLDLWRARADTLGIGELFLVRVESFAADASTPPEQLGFDAAVGWEPNWGRLGPALRGGLLERLGRRLRVRNRAFGDVRVYDYSTLAARGMDDDAPRGYERFPCVVPSWDNTVRRRQGGGVVFRGADPELFELWLRRALERSRREHAPGHRLVFVNAWNEWAEGNHLEPDQRFGRRYIEACARAIGAVGSD